MDQFNDLHTLRFLRQLQNLLSFTGKQDGSQDEDELSKTGPGELQAE
jgi:hypothetical protein